MCGRFAWYNKSTEIIDAFKTVDLNIEKDPIADIPSYNIAPSQKIIVIKSESKTSLTFHQMKWGLETPKIKYGTILIRVCNQDSLQIIIAPRLVSELASEGASGRLLCQVRGSAVQPSFCSL